MRHITVRRTATARRTFSCTVSLKSMTSTCTSRKGTFRASASVFAGPARRKPAACLVPRSCMPNDLLVKLLVEHIRLKDGHSSQISL